MCVCVCACVRAPMYGVTTVRIIPVRHKPTVSNTLSVPEFQCGTFCHLIWRLLCVTVPVREFPHAKIEPCSVTPDSHVYCIMLSR